MLHIHHLKKCAKIRFHVLHSQIDTDAASYGGQKCLQKNTWYRLNPLNIVGSLHFQTTLCNLTHNRLRNLDDMLFIR
jgi:hypothetical protein